ncbi:MAG: hypothetical protein MUC60_17080 [Oscillatoria sp. Prado101]|jgi:hypothetical protein|nr:hypothetical protein [Oscillatoria sp. Prado101]
MRVKCYRFWLWECVGAGAARVTRLDGNPELSLLGLCEQALETVAQESPAGPVLAFKFEI